MGQPAPTSLLLPVQERVVDDGGQAKVAALESRRGSSWGLAGGGYPVAALEWTPWPFRLYTAVLVVWKLPSLAVILSPICRY